MANHLLLGNRHGFWYVMDGSLEAVEPQLATVQRLIPGKWWGTAHAVGV